MVFLLFCFLFSPCYGLSVHYFHPENISESVDSSVYFRANRADVRNLLILVANWEYDKAPLRGPQNDFKLVKSFFESHAEQMGRYEIAEPILNVGVAELPKRLSELQRRYAGTLENLVFFYFGHGRPHKEISYLLTVDLQGVSDLSGFSAVSKQGIGNILKGFKAGRTLVAYDMCFSGIDGDVRSDSSQLQTLIEPGENHRNWLKNSKGFWELNAAREVAKESEKADGKVYGDMTWHLIDGLRDGKADGVIPARRKKGAVTVDDLSYWLQCKIPDQVPSNPLRGSGDFGLLEYDSPEKARIISNIERLLDSAFKTPSIDHFTEANQEYVRLQEWSIDPELKSRIEDRINKTKEEISRFLSSKLEPVTNATVDMADSSEKQAENLFAEAASLLSRALEVEKISAVSAVVFYEDALSRLEQIRRDFPGTNLAVELVSGQKTISPIDLNLPGLRTLVAEKRNLSRQQLAEKDAALTLIRNHVIRGQNLENSSLSRAIDCYQQAIEAAETFIKTYDWSVEEQIGLRNGSLKLGRFGLPELRDFVRENWQKALQEQENQDQQANLIFMGAVQILEGLNCKNPADCYDSCRQVQSALERIKREFPFSSLASRLSNPELLLGPIPLSRFSIMLREAESAHNERLRATDSRLSEARRAEEMAARRKAEEAAALRKAEETSARRKAEREQEAAGIVKQAERILLDFLGLEATVADSLIRLQLNRRRTWRDKSEEEQFLQKRQLAFRSVWLELRKLSAFADTVPGKKYADKALQIFGMNMEEIFLGGLSTGAEETFDNIEFVYIEPGEFNMGSNDGDSDEKPVRKVKISSGFWMGKYELTQGQWKAIMGNNPSVFESGDNYPVEAVSWDDHGEFGVQTFIKKLNKKVCGKEFDSEQVWKANLKEGNKEADGCYRLPTEAEWEYAARAGIDKKYSWGDDAAEHYKYANGADVSLENDKRKWNFTGTDLNDATHKELFAQQKWSFLPGNDGYAYTSPVGNYLPNGWGLYDMHGNVWEWVLDWYDSSYYGKCGSDCTDPANLTKGSLRVDRGGGWGSGAVRLRSAFRGGIVPGGRSGDLGFRLVCPVRR
jgi:formylglycine-generating enzyme required for sulfatase activity